MSVKTRTSGFYRDDAAHIAAEAARIASPVAPTPTAPMSAARPAPSTPAARTAAAMREARSAGAEPNPRLGPVPASRAPEIIIDEPARPPLTPQPAINQNAAVARRAMPERRTRARRRRLIAWIVLAPWYVIVAAGSGFVLVLLGKTLLHL